MTSSRKMAQDGSTTSIGAMNIHESKQDAHECILKSLLEKEEDGRDNGMANITTLCGELKCQYDSALSTWTKSQIVSFAAFQPPPSIKQKGKKKKKNIKKKRKEKSHDDDDHQQQQHDHVVKNDSMKNSNTTTHYAIVLSDSIFFPEGGGQPSDIGEIIVQQREQQQHSNEIRLQVHDGQNIQGICILHCTSDQSLEQTTESLSLAATSTATSTANAREQQKDCTIIQNVNWDKRIEYMTSHSAQHLISAVALKEHGINTQSFSLRANSLSSYIDFMWKNEGDGEELDFKALFHQIEQKVNSHIQSNLPMTPTWYDPTNNDNTTEIRSRVLPKDLKGKIRLVQIGSGNQDEDDDDKKGIIDLNTCCGTHVKHLSEIQMIKFFRIEKFKADVVRVYFSAGKRLLQMIHNTHEQSSVLMTMLSCTEDNFVSRVDKLLDEKKKKQNEVKTLKERLCQLQVKEVLLELKNHDKVAIIDLGHDGVDMEYMTMLSNNVMDEVNIDQCIILYIGSSDRDDHAPQSNQLSDEGMFLLIGHKDVIDKTVGNQIACLLGGRGGGKNGKFQGKGIAIRSNLKEVRKYIEHIKSS